MVNYRVNGCFSAECGDPSNVFDHAGFQAGQEFCVFQGLPSVQWINVIFQILKCFLLMGKNIIRKTQIFVSFEECWTECNEWLLNAINLVVLLTSAKLSSILTGCLMFVF